jgi:DNA modification methylase
MNYQFFNEDCFERMQKMPDKNIELILTDIPYGIEFQNNSWDKFDDYGAFLNKLLSNFKRILKDDGVIWMFCAPTMFDIVDKAIMDCGLINHYDFWKSIQRQKGRGAKSKPKSQREDILLITKTNNYTFNNLSDIFKYDETVTNTLDVTIGEVYRPEFNINDKVFYFKMPYYLSKTEKMFHSCQKSILLLYSLIVNFSKENDTVFDPFAGSGSCGISALLANRNFLGCELDTERYNKALEWKNKFDFETYKKTFLKDITANE